MPRRREMERLRKKEEIIDAAEQIYFQKGYNKTTMDDIASELELTKPALYRYFNSKEDLYLAVVLRAVKILKDTMMNYVNKKDKGLDKILATGYAYWKFSDEYSDYCHLMIEASEINPQCMDYTNQKEENPLTIMCKAIETGKNDGTIRKDIDTFLTATYLIESTIAVIRVSEIMEDHLQSIGKTKKDFIEHSLKLMENGIKLGK